MSDKTSIAERRAWNAWLKADREAKIAWSLYLVALANDGTEEEE